CTPAGEVLFQYFNPNGTTAGGPFKVAGGTQEGDATRIGLDAAGNATVLYITSQGGQILRTWRRFDWAANALTPQLASGPGVSGSLYSAADGTFVTTTADGDGVQVHGSDGNGLHPVVPATNVSAIAG